MAKAKQEVNRETIRARLIAKSQNQGAITYDDIIELMPEAERDIGLLDEIMEQLMDAGVDVVASAQMDISLLDDLDWTPENDSVKIYPDIYVADFTLELLKLLKFYPSEILNISPDAFELLICDRLRAMGYEVYRDTNNANTRDGGIDIIAYVPKMAMSGLIAVQAKHHRSEMKKTGAKVIRELSGVISGRPNFNSGLVVTNTAFTKDALEERKSMTKNISLRDWQDLVRWIKNDFTGEEVFRELPENIILGSNIVIPRSRFKRL
jgi:restriction endonuclease Mrr